MDINFKMKNRWLSKSQVNCFRQCTHRWKLQYIDRLPQEGLSEELNRGKEINKRIIERCKNKE